MTTRARNPIKWVGAKGRESTLARLLSLVPTHIDCYFEPFFGSGALFFAMAEQGLMQSAILSDLNHHLIDTWQSIKDAPEHVLHWLRIYESLDGADLYYGIRVKFNLGPLAFPEPGAFAAAFIYLNRAGYNGLYRVNAKGEFNGPFSSKRRVGYNIVQEDAIRRASELLNKVSAVLVCADFATIIPHATPNDFVYCDPPYAGTFSEYACPRFEMEDHERLRDVLEQASTLFMVSNSAVEEVFEMYKGYNLHASERSNSVNANAADRGAKPDLIITNY